MAGPVVSNASAESVITVVLDADTPEVGVVPEDDRWG